MARIPDAYFSGGFGQAVVHPLEPQSKGAVIGQAVGRLADTAQRIAADEIHYQGQMELNAAQERRAEAERQQREAEAEQQRLQREADKSAAMSSLMAHENALTDVVREIKADPAVKTADYLATFQQQAENVKSKFLASVPEEYKVSFAPAFEQHIYSARNQLNDIIAGEIRDSAKANVSTMIEELQRSPKSRSQKLAILDEALGNDDVFRAAGYGPDDKATLRQKFAETTAEDEIEQRLSDSAPLKIMEALHAKEEDGSFHNWRELDPGKRESYYQAAKSRHQAMLAEQERARKERERERKDAARDAYDLYKEAKEGLLPLSVKEEAHLLRQMSGTPYEARAKAVRQKTTSIGFVTDKIKSDPLTYGAATLGLSVPPLDPRTATDWPAQLRQREEIGKVIQQKYGLAFTPVLTNQEAAGLVELAKGQSPQGLVQTFGALQQIPGMKGAGLKQIARQFYAADPGLAAVVGLVASDKPVAAYNVANGQRLIREKAVPMPKSATDGLTRLFDNEMGDALQHAPANRATLSDAVTAAYVSMAAQKGLDTKESPDKATYREAFAAVVGGTAKVNGRRVVLPSGWSEGMMMTSLRKLTGDIVSAAGGVRGVDPARAAALIQDDGQLYEAGDGVYRVAVDGRFLQTNDGRDFRLYFGGK